MIQTKLDKLMVHMETSSAKEQTQDREDKEKSNRMIFSNYTHMTQRFDELTERFKFMQDTLCSLAQGADNSGVGRQTTDSTLGLNKMVSLAPGGLNLGRQTSNIMMIPQ